MRANAHVQKTLLSPRVFLYSGHPAPCPSRSDELALEHLPQEGVFGDGSHPTTRLCAGALDSLCRLDHPAAVLDIGTGTGVLARIARARGAKRVVGTDIDSFALETARANAELDRHPVEIHWTYALPSHFGPSFDLVVANILEGPLCELADEIQKSLLPGGAVLLSGFTRLQIPQLISRFSSARLTWVSSSHLDEWSLLLFRNPKAPHPHESI